MAKLRDRLVDPAPWADLIMGNEALARAMIDSGTRVITTFPGSPTPEIGAALGAVAPEKRPYKFEWSVNEKVALEVATGASLNGHPSCCFFKSVGLNVASDSLVQLGLLELIGGMVVILGDDPGANSSQNEQDNRWFSRMSYIPMLEPATPQEAYDMYREAMRLSQERQMPVLLRLTTHVCHAREVVDVHGFHDGVADEYAWEPRFAPENGPYVPITVTVFPLKRRALAKLAEFEAWADTCAFNGVLAPGGSGPAPDGKRLGVVASSLAANSVIECLTAAGQPVDLLKLGVTYPLPRGLVAGFLADHDEVLVIEELDRVHETEIKALAYEQGSACRILARTDAEDLMGELGPRRSWGLLHGAWPELFPAKDDPPGAAEVVPRLPQMCPGCGHRSAFQAITAALGEDDITVADIGCHSLGFMPPYEVGTVLLCMGHSVPTGSGLALGNDSRPVLSLIGDATLFHAGLPGIINAATYDHNVTLVIMENGTTAMTGHQPRFGSGEVGDKIDLPAMLRDMGVEFIRECDTYQQAKLTDHVKEALAHKGFSVVIARHPCMLKFTRERQRKQPGVKMPQVVVDEAACTQAHVCTAEFGCPSFVRHEDGTVTVNWDLCIGDGSCLQVCPSGAIGRSKQGGE